MKEDFKSQKFVFLGILLLIMFTFPFISMANRSIVVAGIPVLFLYIFIVWTGAIIVLYRLANRNPPKTDE